MMQFNNSKDSYYIASNVASSAPIKEVTVKLNSSKTSNGNKWKLLTSTSPYGQVSKKPSNGNDWETKTVTTSGVTWTLSGNDTYFALTYEDSGVCYVDSITITYGSSGEDVGGTHSCQHVCAVCQKCTDLSCSDAACSDKCQGHGGAEGGGDSANLNAFREAVNNIVTSGTLQERLTSLKQAITAYKALSESDKVAGAGDIQRLQEAINDYNQMVGAYNDDALAANKAIG